MSKFEKIDEDVLKLFNEVLNETSIPHWINFELMCNNQMKDIYQVKKLNELIENLTDGLQFVVIINEEIFLQLNDDQQKILIGECLAGVSISETDTVSYEKPDFTTYSGVLAKHGHEEIIVLKESIKSLFEQKKQKEDELKQAKKKRN